MKKIVIRIEKLLLLAVIYAGVEHFSHHNCIACAAVAALIYLRRS